MDRVAISAILIVLLGVWVTPFLTGAGRPTTAAARDTLAPLAAATRASTSDVDSLIASTTESTADSAAGSATAPATQPQITRFPTTRGADGYWRVGQTADH